MDEDGREEATTEDTEDERGVQVEGEAGQEAVHANRLESLRQLMTMVKQFTFAVCVANSVRSTPPCNSI